MKKILSVILALAMVVNIFAGAKYSVKAKEENATDTVIIYYVHSGWSSVYAHYKTTKWTKTPGKKMSLVTINNVKYEKITIDLEDLSEITICFNNGHGRWDNNAHKNYKLPKGIYYIEYSGSKKISKITKLGKELEMLSDANNKQKITEDTMYCDIYDKSLLTEKQLSDIETVINSGIEEEDLNNITMEVISTMANSLRQYADGVSICSETKTFDELKNIEEINNLSVTELEEKTGASREQIIEAKEDAEELSNLSDKELKEEYGLDSCDIKVCRKATEKIDDYETYKNIDEDNKVTLSSGIATSQLTFSQIVCLKSTKPYKYIVCDTFNWKKGYYPYQLGFEDAIGVAWSGGFTSETTSKKMKYHVVTGTLFTGWGWGKYVGYKNATVEKTPSKGVVYSFDQDYDMVAWAQNVKQGSITLDITSKYSKKKNMQAEIVSCYGHKGIGFAGVDISGAPTITFGSAYSYTDQDSTSKIISY